MNKTSPNSWAAHDAAFEADAFTPVVDLPTERKKTWLLMVILWAILLLFALLRPLAVPDEGRYGEVGRWMLQSGDWLTPRLDGIPFFHKPPLLYWLEAISMGALGVNELAARGVPALHVGLMMVALYLVARTVSSEALARRAVLMLGTSLTFMVGGQYVNHDMMVASWMGVAIWCFAYAFMQGDKPHAMWARAGFAACALAVLSKGLIGVVLPGMVLFIWLLWTRQFKKVLYLPWVSGIAILAVIVAPWFVVASQKYPGLLDYMVVNQHFKRYTATGFNNPQPWWFYLVCIVFLLFPWIFWVGNQFKHRTPTSPDAPQGAYSEGLSAAAQAHWWRLCWAWVLGIVVFFSLPTSKLIGYILPVMPPLALLAAWGWEHSMARRRHAKKVFVALGVFNLVLIAVVLVALAHGTREGRSKDVALALACAMQPTDTVYVAKTFPYDLPFYAQTSKPLVVVDNWPVRRKTAGDGWQRELFEGADFDPQAGQVLQMWSVLGPAGATAGNWLILPAKDTMVQTQPALQAWQVYFKGVGWTLYRSGDATMPDLTMESPKPPQHKGLPGCNAQRHQQG